MNGSPKPRNLFTNEVFDQLIQQLFNSSCCNCTSCSTHRLEKMAYDWIQGSQEFCPTTWQKIGTAVGFVNIFEKRRKVKMSVLFPSSKCVSALSVSQLENQLQSSVSSVLPPNLTNEAVLLPQQVPSVFPNMKNVSEQSDSLQTSKIVSDEDCKLMLTLLKRFPPPCSCTNCAKSRLRKMAYLWATKLKICPESWKKEKCAAQEWLDTFEKEIKNISEVFPSSECVFSDSTSSPSSQSQSLLFATEDVDKSKLLQTSKVFNDEDCKWLLTLLKKFLSRCPCTTCARKCLRELAYECAKKLHVCPKSWMKEKRAPKKWLHIFEKEIKNISEIFPSSKCVSSLSVSQLASQSQSSLSDAQNVSQLSQSTDKSDFHMERALCDIGYKFKTIKEAANYYGIPLHELKYEVVFFMDNMKTIEIETDDSDDSNDLIFESSKNIEHTSKSDEYNCELKTKKRTRKETEETCIDILPSTQKEKFTEFD
ncbi:uncharacterized protein LOC105426796 [Pogonomyrmex barbatus]|uniref:Uncharacterized protein LOC105426796 n=1 Tax=Pogonomyrmex barbatus TaxID=144034 RepID=A0A6I9W3R3_9HYME|nr:uncharacterized protein LOC105426796 [Pogonomyrmex barbatus]XP_025073977.1 uncharacterized protein LOC105426796 [Pogonomyrmex barbatus]